MAFRLGILGVGNMGEALLKGILQKNAVEPEKILLFDQSADRLKQMADTYAVDCAKSTDLLVRETDIVLLAAKPNVCESILRDCADVLADKAILSIVTGWTKSDFHKFVPDCRVLCVMPNTPCMVGEGMCVFNKAHSLSADEYAFAKTLFEAVGQVSEASGELMPAVTAVSGSGPAYVYLFIEALADGGVLEGLPRQQAYQLAAQTVLGAAKMVLETGIHPGALKDAVCSPGGTTIEAVSALERAGLRAAVLDATATCANKAKQLQQK